MAEIDLLFMKGNRETVKAMQTVWSPEKERAFREKELEEKQTTESCTEQKAEKENCNGND